MKKSESDALNEFLIELGNELAELIEMMQVLGEDCDEHYATIQSNDNQMHRRAYVRAVLALMEGILYRMKRTAFHVGRTIGSISMAEIFMIDGVSIEINDKGEAYPKPVFIKFLHNIKFSFKVYSKSVGSSFELSLGGIGWQKLLEAVKVRDRLMHPKTTASLQVTDNGVEAAKKAFDWFLISYMLCSYYAQKAARAKSSHASEGMAAIDIKIQEWQTKLNNIGN